MTLFDSDAVRRAMEERKAETAWLEDEQDDLGLEGEVGSSSSAVRAAEHPPSAPLNVSESPEASGAGVSPSPRASVLPALAPSPFAAIVRHPDGGYALATGHLYMNAHGALRVADFALGNRSMLWLVVSQLKQAHVRHLHELTDGRTT